MKDTIVQGLEQAYYNLVHMIAEFLPRLVVMMVIIIVGLLVAFVVRHLLRGLLRLTKLDRVSEDAGASRVLRMADLPSMTELLSRSIFWITWIGFFLIGISVLGVAGLQEQISRLFRFLPEVFIAILILFLGLIIANFLSRTALLASVNAGLRSPRIVAWSIRFVIWILAISMALEELGLARQTVIAAFSIVFGASMLGLAIAFGLGGQDLARRTLERYLGDSQKEDYNEPQPL
jgi:quinol-cytochrome oxidoreductase complex cytochrome b subunit